MELGGWVNGTEGWIMKSFIDIGVCSHNTGFNNLARISEDGANMLVLHILIDGSNSNLDGT